jgi:hypothetical protein
VTTMPVPGRSGSFGLLGLSTAEVGAPGRLTLAAHASYAEAVGLLVIGERNTRADADCALSFTPHPNVEVFGAVLIYGDRESGSAAFPDGSTVGDRGGSDLLLGAKVASRISRIAPALEIGMRAPAALTAVPSSLSAWATLLASIDLIAGGRTPIRAHLAVGYYRDGSRAQIGFTGVPEATRQVELYAYGMGADRVRVGLGLDAAIAVAQGRFALRPLAEYHLEVVTDHPDPAFRNEPPFNRDEHWLAFGLRTLVGPDLAFDLGTEIALRSVGFLHGPPLAPYQLLVGAAFTVR